MIGGVEHESRSWPIHGRLGGMALSVELRAFPRGPLLEVLRLLSSPGEDPGEFLGTAREAYSTARPGRCPRRESTAAGYQWLVTLKSPSRDTNAFSGAIRETSPPVF